MKLSLVAIPRTDFLSNNTSNISIRFFSARTLSKLRSKASLKTTYAKLNRDQERARVIVRRHRRSFIMRIQLFLIFKKHLFFSRDAMLVSDDFNVLGNSLQI